MFLETHPWETNDRIREIQAALILVTGIFFVPGAVYGLFPSLPGVGNSLISSAFSLTALFFLKPREIGVHLPKRLDILAAILGALLLGAVTSEVNGWWKGVMSHFNLEIDYQYLLTVYSDFSWQEQLLQMLSTALITPVTEELLFRRLLYGFLLKINSLTALILSALIFSAVHFFLAGLPGLFLYGIVFQLLFLTTKNLFTPMLAHMLLNGTVLLNSIL